MSNINKLKNITKKFSSNNYACWDPMSGTLYGDGYTQSEAEEAKSNNPGSVSGPFSLYESKFGEEEEYE